MNIHLKEVNGGICWISCSVLPTALSKRRLSLSLHLCDFGCSGFAPFELTRKPGKVRLGVQGRSRCMRGVLRLPSWEKQAKLRKAWGGVRVELEIWGGRAVCVAGRSAPFGYVSTFLQNFPIFAPRSWLFHICRVILSVYSMFFNPHGSFTGKEKYWYGWCWN